MRQSLETIRQELKDIHARQQLPIDSYIVIYGPTLENISAAYVVLGDVTYQASNVNSAVDIRFQSMKVFDKNFLTFALTYGN